VGRRSLLLLLLRRRDGRQEALYFSPHQPLEGVYAL